MLKMRKKRKRSYSYKDIGVCIIFSIIIIGFLCANLLTRDLEISDSERRTLSKMPVLSTETILDGTASKEFENYALDQFVGRDTFRFAKSFINQYVFAKKVNDGIYVQDGMIYKMDYPLKTKQVQLAVNKINSVYEEYLQGMNCYYAIIPDKSNYAASEYGFLSLDYKELKSLVTSQISHMTYIGIWDCLDKYSYYATDIHWRQEQLFPVVKRLEEQMHLEDIQKEDSYDRVALQGFRGGYYGQAARPLPSEELVYLESDVTKESTVYNVEKKVPTKVYEVEKYEGIDPYDLYLSGASAILEITNTKSRSQKELIMFRDSFASSLTPLLLSSYKKITLVDLRYVSSSLLGQYIEFDNQDVLFLYSVGVLNHGGILR